MDSTTARVVCHEAHRGQRDKGGAWYFMHPYDVAAAMCWLGEDFEVVAYLHDVLEDTDYELDAADFTDLQWEALYAITRQPDESYAEYIFRCRRNFIARVVKIADIHDNLKPRRMEQLLWEDQQRLQRKYRQALAFLTNDRLAYMLEPEA